MTTLLRPTRPPAPARCPGPLRLDAVFVDVDNTLIKGSALFHLGRGLVASGLLDRAQMARMAGSQVLFRMLGERTWFMTGAQRRTRDAACGLPAAAILARLDELCDEFVVPHCWTGVLRLLADHRTLGAPIWLATAAPVALAEALARCLGLDGALGTEVQRAGDVFTGRLGGPLVHGPAKAAAVADLAAARGWELQHCAAYSDSAADLPLLSAVGHPAVVNPERGLAAIARRRGWRVYDFRARHLTDRVVAPLRHRPDGTGRPAVPAVARIPARVAVRTDPSDARLSW